VVVVKEMHNLPVKQRSACKGKAKFTEIGEAEKGRGHIRLGGRDQHCQKTIILPVFNISTKKMHLIKKQNTNHKIQRIPVMNCIV
jgi:hypothetical protein